jgi:hypothetical protein
MECPMTSRDNGTPERRRRAANFTLVQKHADGYVLVASQRARAFTAPADGRETDSPWFPSLCRSLVLLSSIIVEKEERASERGESGRTGFAHLSPSCRISDFIVITDSPSAGIYRAF